MPAANYSIFLDATVAAWRPEHRAILPHLYATIILGNYMGLHARQ